MKQLNIKDILSISIIITLIFYIYLHNEENNDFFGIEERDKQIEQLQKDNNRYLNSVLEQEIRIQQINKRVDSLESLKPKIVEKTKYINNEIDKANCNQLITKFDSIFSSASIK